MTRGVFAGEIAELRRTPHPRSNRVRIGGALIRKFLGLTALAALLGPVSCLSSDGPKPFSTADSCSAGDVEGCTCEVKGKPSRSGMRGCATNQTFSGSDCRCNAGCTLYPDCDSCGENCFEKCMCQRMGQRDECLALCPVTDAGS